MKKLFTTSNIKRSFVFFVLSILMPLIAFSQGPSATELADNMVVGWNIGNSLEVPDGETAWGNPAVNKQLIDAVKAAGFNTVRIPAAWNSYVDPTSHKINETWLMRVKEVVDYCIDNEMYVILNSHWDGGWLEEHPTYDKQQEVNLKQEKYWVQIAGYFNDYDEHLLFAGTNEVRANYGTPTKENIEVQESYNQTFVDAVRSTGGNNAFRNLIVQTYNTNIGHGLNYFTLPNDVIDNRLMVEVHYYDPYDFTLNENTNTACINWGAQFADEDVCNWGQEDHVDDLFGKLKQKFADKGVPVILGEYGVIHRSALTGDDYEMHSASRNYFLEYVTKAAVDRGFIPVYWDNGYFGNNGFALFNRNTGSIVDENALNALMRGAGIIDAVATYTLATSSIGSGSITVGPSQNDGVYEFGTEVTLTAIPAEGMSFSGWTRGGLSGTENPVKIIINSNKTITANFEIDRITGTMDEEAHNSKSEISAYPNPFKEFFTLKFADWDSVKEIEILDYSGKVLTTIERSHIFEKIELGKNLRPGIYLVRVINDKGVQALRVMKN